jgi:L-ascorbate metabolism protein UlaG (beta-lactamase superfamily)
VKRIKRILRVLSVVGLLACAWLVYKANDHPSLSCCSQQIFAAPKGPATGLHVTFLGVSTLLFDDGETAILTDGFFTRPGKLRFLFTKIGPDPELIARDLQRAGIQKLAAVVVVHSHYDHAMDSPEVAKQTGAQLIGSQSTANIALGYGFPKERLTIVGDSANMSFGRFQITLLAASHVPSALAPKGNIDNPLKSPAWWWQYKEGGSYSVLIEHDGKTILVQGSAGFKPDALQGRSADLVFLGIGQLGKQDDAYRELYWQQVVASVHPRRIIPIHWDDFWLPLDQPLVPFPRLTDNFEKSIEFLNRRGHQENIEVKILPAWLKVDPFE